MIAKAGKMLVRLDQNLSRLSQLRPLQLVCILQLIVTTEQDEAVEDNHKDGELLCRLLACVGVGVKSQSGWIQD